MSIFSLNCQLPPHVYRLLAAFTVECADMALAIPPLMATLSTVVQGKFAVLHPSGHPSELSMYWMGIADSSACKGGESWSVRSPLESIIGKRVEQDKKELAETKIMNSNIDAELKPLRRKLHRLEGDEREETVKKIASLEAEKKTMHDVFVFDTQDITDAGLIKLLSGQDGNRIGILDAE